jgi:hypothetical protein
LEIYITGRIVYCYTSFSHLRDILKMSILSIYL